MMAGQPSGVIFDLDGTLVDSAADIASILNNVLVEERTSSFSVDEVAALMGHGIRATIEKALRARGRDAEAQKLEHMERKFAQLYVEAPIARTRPYPHAVEVLSALSRRGLRVGVCTNKAEAPARLVLDHTGLGPHVSALVGGDSGYGMKPDPRPLRACARKLGVPLRSIAYVGDHAVDIATARGADVPVIVACYGYGGTEVHALGADGTIGCLSELAAALAALAPRCRPCP